MPNDPVLLTGDEALLLSEVATTWTGSDRAASARSAIAAGAEFLLMDDGLQNPSLAKSASLLVIDGVRAFGNRLVFPAGPLRESISEATSRCLAAVMIGPDVDGVRDEIRKCVPVLDADLVQSADVAPLVGKRAFVFSGIAYPAKFFETLQRSGVEIVGEESFPDHHVFTTSELIHLEAAARKLDAALVTTPKDAVRLPKGMSVHVVGVKLLWKSEVAIEALLDGLILEQNLYSPTDPGLDQGMSAANLRSDLDGSVRGC
jgi:tetraacyldisaccharide 4'-kinase